MVAIPVLKAYEQPPSDHISELNSERPKSPFFFLKPPSAIIEPPAPGPVIRPRGVDLHYEVELALVIKQSVKSLNENDTEAIMDAIGGMSEEVPPILCRDDLTGTRLCSRNRHDRPESPRFSKKCWPTVDNSQRFRYFPPTL